MRKLLLLVLLLEATFSIAQTNEDWIPKGVKDGVKVFYRKKTDIYELKLVTSVQTTLSGIIQLFHEVENYPLWGYKVKDSRLLKRISETEIIYYTKIDFPWPLDDRDVILHSKLEQDPFTKRVTSISTALPDYLPAYNGVVRMRDANTKWVLVPGTGGWLYIEYYLHSDPGGSIPDWAVNLGLDMGPRETIKNLRTLLQQQKYQSAKLAHIKE